MSALFSYLALGIAFGLVLVKAEVVSWFRIQEMFRFHSFHMYGIIGTAVLTAGAGALLLKTLDVRGADGMPIALPPKEMGTGVRYAVGGTLFGVGWSLTGACPGPLFALVGAGTSVLVVAMAAALAGTWAYGVLRPRLPH